MKRKLKEAGELPGIEQKSKKIKDDGSLRENLEDTEEVEEMETEEVSEYFDSSLKFDIKKFRQNLKAGNFYDDLKLFIKKAAKSPEIIRAFTESGGKPLEIAEIIKNNEESSLEVISNLYHMLRMLIFYIVNDEAQIMDPTIQALKFLVNKNKVSIEKMLASSRTPDKVLMLKILSIAVSLDSAIGWEILKNIDIFAKSTEKEDFSSLIDNKKQKTSYDESVRLAFVHFILAFLLNDKDVYLRKKVLLKHSLFEFFLSGLHGDDFETVKSIITCLTKNILISPAFSKPDKLKIFTDNAVRSVLKLYESDRNDIVVIAHQFLLLLLTSKKHGIVFKALSEKRQNQRQLQVVNLFKNVWNLEYQSMLVIEIIKSCPDLMQNILNRLVMGLQPKLAANFFMCANFTRELLTALEPSVVFCSFSMLEAKKISANIIKLAIPQYILQNLNERALIQHDSLEIRETSTQILYLMLDRCCKYLEEVRKDQTLKDYERHRIKFDIINHIFTFFPKIDIILNSLYRSINQSRNKSNEESEKLVKSQLKNTLEILLLLIENFPAIIEKIPSVIDYLEVLRPIYEYKLTGAAEYEGKNEDLEIEMKVLKIILFLQPSILSLDSEMFQKIFLILIQVFCSSPSGDFQKEARVLLFGILTNVGIFSADSQLEIGIWLEAFRSIASGLVKESAINFVKAMRSIKVSKGGTVKWAVTDVVDCSYDLLEMIDTTDGAVEDVPQHFDLSPILPTLLNIKSDKINRIIEFVEISVALLYHSYPQMKTSFIELLDSRQSELNTSVANYIKKKSLVEFEVVSDTLYGKFQNAVISSDEIDLDVKDPQQIELLIIQAVFCAIQLEKSGKFNDSQINLLVSHMDKFFKKLLQNETDQGSSVDSSGKNLETDSKKVNKIFELKTESTSKSIISYIFKEQILLLDSFDIAKLNQLTRFIGRMTEIFKLHEDYEKSTSNFRSKIVADLKEVLDSGSMGDEVLDIIGKFPFDDANCINMVTILTKQKAIKDFHVKLAKMVLNRLLALKNSPLSTKLMQKLEKFYVEASENTPIDMSEFESSFLSYLMTFPHSIGDLSGKIFSLAFREDQSASKSFVRLITTLFARTKTWNDVFKNNLMKCKKEILYPLLGVAFDKNIITTDQLKPIYQEFKSGTIKAIEKPNKAAQIYRENAQTSVKLIELAMPLNECQDLSMKKYKFDASEVYQLKMLHAIFSRVTLDEKIYMNFLNHWFNLYALAANKSPTVSEEYFEVLESWLKIKPSKISADQEISQKSWETFYRNCLKNGLKSADGAKALVLLGKVIRATPINPEDVTTIFDMIFTHSNFFNVIFNFKTSGRLLKTNLFYLLNILVQSNPAVAHEKHVPILLSAYQATMSPCDQLILNMMRFYELRCEVDFFDFRPFLFGYSALAHFTNSDEQEMKLVKKSVEDMNQLFFKLLSSYEKSTIDNTVNNFPIKRQLAGVAADRLDDYLIDTPELDNIYDPGYYLPLFEMILTSSTFEFTSFAIRNNLLKMVMPALSCEDENMRLLAAHVLLKVRENVQNKKSSSEVWIRFFDSLQQGLSEVVEGTKTDDKEKHFPRPASVSTQFLAEITSILPDSLHHVYMIVTHYLTIKPNFDFSSVPELMSLFQSHDVQQDEHRNFLLNVILNGIKDDLDFKLLNSTLLFKIILSSYGSPLSDRKIDLTILKIVDRVVMKTSKIDILVHRYGLATWIFQAAVKVEAFEYETIEMILGLIEHLSAGIRKNLKDDGSNSKILLNSLMMLLPKFTKTKLSARGFSSFLTTINGISKFEHIKKEHHDLIADLIKIFVPEDILRHVTYLEDHPEAVMFLESKENIKKSLPSTLDAQTKEILLESREFIMKFHRKQK